MMIEHLKMHSQRSQPKIMHWQSVKSANLVDDNNDNGHGFNTAFILIDDLNMN